MNSDKFLSAVADYYISASNRGEIDLSEVCLVFPNKRAAIFFRRYFKQCLIDAPKTDKERITFIPDINTIGAFYERFYGGEIADRIQLQFVLYKAYCKVLSDRGFADRIKTFDRFAFLGDMILSDFDDIDKEMANAHDVYANIERYNEISSNFLTEEQIEVLRTIWGKDLVSGLESRNGDKNERLWNHVKDADETKDGKASHTFIRFWQILNPLYDEFKKLLEAEGLAYPGLVSSEVARNICSHSDLDDLPFRRIGFVGFNMVNTSLAKMMKHLQSHDAADFFWDLLPSLPYAKRAGERIAKLSEAFPMPAAYVPPVYNISECKIVVYGVPSNTLQAKAAGGVIEHWKSQFVDTSVPDNTVVVLPDQSLLSPMLNALPKDLGTVNITMGLSYRDTPFATLLRTIVSLHLRCREIYGENYFFHEDISALIANPNMRAIALDSCLAIKAYLDHFHQYNVSADRLCETIRKTGVDAAGVLTPGAEALLCIFTVVPRLNDINLSRQYISNLMTALNKALQQSADKVNSNAHEVKVLNAYQQAIDHVFECIDRYRIKTLSEGSIFGMLERLLAVNTLNMSGTPLSGLQIMGVLETRAIDFENVIIMSMNEDVYPRRNRIHSLIPQFIRSAYMLPTAGDSEQEYSYYFFRLFSRSKRVVCLYDSRTSGSGNGAMSRYLLQFQHLYPQAKISFETCSLFAKQTEERKIVIRKADVIDELNAFKSNGPDAINLSASALKKYRKCRLAFYLEYVKRVREDDTPVAFMDAATYGNVMHHVLQNLFKEQRPGDNPVVITEQVIDKMKKANILDRVKREINKLYHQNSFKHTDRLPAESLILAEIMSEFIMEVLERESLYIKEYGTFDFVDAEESVTTQWAVTKKNTVNFRFDIDRHDILDHTTHRFVDYKTGSDDTAVKSIAGLFSTEKSQSNDAAFQLLTYAAAYSDIKQVKYNIRPALYRLKAVMSDKSKIDDDALTLTEGSGKSKITQTLVWVNHGEIPKWQQEFRENLEKMIDSIFSEDEDFTQTTEIENCRYCSFLQMCSRIVPDKNR